MKKLKISAFALFAIVTLASCGDDDNASNNSSNQQQINEIVAVMRQDTWRITTFVDSGADETNHFTGYTFTFGNNGTLTAVKGETTVTGLWSVTDDNSSDDDPGSDIDFNIGFTAPADFIDLTDDWDISERNPNRISLIDVSGGNGGTDILVFEKIQ
jgi:hypothetical protein